MSPARSIFNLLPSFENSREYLVVRIADTSEVNASGQSCVCEERIPGLSCVLMIVDEVSAATVPAEILEAWGRSAAELIDVALQNVARLEAGVQPRDLSEASGAGRLFMFEGRTVDGGAMALRLETLPGMVGPHGALVTVPIRNSVFSVPIHEGAFVKDLQPLLGATRYLTREGALGRVSRRLWWYRGGQWVELPYEVQDNALPFMPPAAFNEMVQGLVGEG